VDEHAAHDDKENKRAAKEEARLLVSSVKRDFFGRIIEAQPLQELDANGGGRRKRKSTGESKGRNMVWVTFHEGLNNAVRKPISLQEFLKGL